MKKISSIKELKEICLSEEGKYFEFFILLNGNIRSSKTICYYEGHFEVVNEIDGTTGPLR